MNEHIIVTESTGEFKNLSKLALKDLWIPATIGYFIYYIFTNLVPRLITSYFPTLNYTFTEPNLGLVLSTSPIIYLYRFFLIGPFVVGLKKFILRIIRRREVDNKLLFYGFKGFFKSFLLQLLIGVLTFLYILPLSIAMVAFAGISEIVYQFLSLAVLVVGIWVYLRYILAPYFMADDWSLSPLACIKLSVKNMKGNIGKLLILMISFLGWLILSLIPGALLQGMYPNAGAVGGFLISLVANLPSFFVMVYISVAEGFFYELASGRLKKQATYSGAFSM